MPQNMLLLDFNSQLKLLGNSFSFSFLISLFISILLFTVSFFPDKIISDLSNNRNKYVIASVLIKILSVSSIIQILINYVGSIFEINLKKYYWDFIPITSSVISLVFFFILDKTNYDWIIYYFGFIKILDLIGLFVLIFLSQKIFKIKLADYWLNFRVSKNLIKKGFKLSITSFRMTSCALILYEFDNLFLAQIFDLKTISFFSVAALGPILLKSIFSFLYSPFNPIFNYYKNDATKLKEYLRKIILFFFPLIFLGILIIIIFSKEIIYSYVGSGYFNSIQILNYLCLSLIFTFLIEPTKIYLYTMEFNKRLVLTAILPPLCFWVLNFYNLNITENLDLEVFSKNKMYAILILVPLYLHYLIRDKILDKDLIVNILKSLILGISIIGMLLMPIKYIMIDEKSIGGVIFNVFILLLLILIIKGIDLLINKNQLNLGRFIKKNYQP